VQFDCAVPDLEAELKALLAQVPAGRVTTYGDLADALGTRNAARWVGEFLRNHRHSARCPCHRVVRKGGQLGLFVIDRDSQEKAELLRHEGLRITRGVVAQFEEHRFQEFKSSRPLARLIELQKRIARSVRLVPFADTPPFAAGFDVSYTADGYGVGACAIVETGSGRLLWSATKRRRAELPYIPGMLTFRELPLLLELFHEAKSRSPELNLCLVDGNGVLHPRRAGVATCFGVVADVPTIGVAKSLLCGRVDRESPPIEGQQPVRIDEEVVGTALSWGRSRHPLYVSPGQKIDVASAARTAAIFNHGHRLPEPLFWADHLSRVEARRKA
jgi:deoxyribonuclease V